jgi:hypothetical protein
MSRTSISLSLHSDLSATEFSLGFISLTSKINLCGNEDKKLLVIFVFGAKIVGFRHIAAVL